MINNNNETKIKTSSKLREKTLLKRSDINSHYQNPAVKEIIQRCCRDGDYWRAGNIDFSGWYKKDSPERGKKRLWDLTDDSDYNEITSKCRSLYWTLNFFGPNVTKQNIPNSGKDSEGNELTLGDRSNTKRLSLGVDIDKAHGCDIHTKDVKLAVKYAAQFMVNKLKTMLPDSIHVAFSGGGIHIYIHHKCFKHFPEIAEDDIEHIWYQLQEAFNFYIKDVEKEFFEKYPEHKDKVKFDALNNQKRVFKTIFSVHKKLPYAVIPLNLNNINIKFDDAKLPIKKEILEHGQNWYKTWDTDITKFLLELKKYEYQVIEKYPRDIKIDVKIADEEIIKDYFPPCIKRVLQTKKMYTGKTRAITFFATFLGQCGWDKKNAYELFARKACELGAQKSNIFRSWFGKMNTPKCITIQKRGQCFPAMNMGELSICKPDEICQKIRNPFEYACVKKNRNDKNKRKNKINTKNFSYENRIFRAEIDDSYIFQGKLEWNFSKKCVIWHYQILKNEQQITAILKSLDALSFQNSRRDNKIVEELIKVGLDKNEFEKITKYFLEIPITDIDEDIKYLEDTKGKLSQEEYKDFISGQSKKEEYSKEAKELAELRMKDGSALYHIGVTLQSYHVGEPESILSAFLDVCSSFSPDPQMLKIGGPSSSGKTDLANTILLGVPKKYYKKIGSMSPTALKHTNWEKMPDLKIIYFQEASGIGQEGIENIKLMSSDDGGLIAEWTEGSPSKSFKTVSQKIPVKTIITTSTKISIDDEFENRLHTINVDESTEQTGLILDRQASIAADDHDKKDTEWIRAYIEMLEPFDKIIIPFAYVIRKLLSDDRIKARRDINKIFSQIKMSAFINQKNRPTIENDGKRKLIAIPEDAYNGFIISLPSFLETVSGMTKTKEAILEIIKNNLDSEEITSEKRVPISYREIVKKLHQEYRIKKSKKQIQRICVELENDTYVDIIRGGGKQKSDIVKFCDEFVKLQEVFEKYKTEICNQTKKAFEEKYPECSFEIKNIVIHPISGISEKVFEISNRNEITGGTYGTSQRPIQYPTNNDIVSNNKYSASINSLIPNNEKRVSETLLDGEYTQYNLNEDNCSKLNNIRAKTKSVYAKQDLMSPPSKSQENNVLNNCLEGKQDAPHDRDIYQDILMSHMSQLSHQNIKDNSTPEKEAMGYSEEPMQRDRIFIFLNIIRKYIEPDGFAPLDKVKHEAALKGYARSELDADIARLKREGRIFIEPFENRIGVV
jgi:hypothetical protein